MFTFLALSTLISNTSGLYSLNHLLRSESAKVVYQSCTRCILMESVRQWVWHLKSLHNFKQNESTTLDANEAKENIGIVFSFPFFLL